MSDPDRPPPGYYPAAGDPEGTVRYWDGAQWTGDPIPPPPGYVAPGQSDRSRYGGVGIRIGAALIDGLISVLVLIPAIWSEIERIVDEVDAGASSSEVEFQISAGAISLNLVVVLAFWLMTGLLGGTPGKLLLGLRVTTEDSATTPPGLTKAAMRTLPAVIGFIPVVGPLIGLALVVLSIVWVMNDAERRSPYDRIAGTRVVRKERLGPAT
ncbi:MAG: RDD family protein [Actinomycetota bacterium]